MKESKTNGARPPFGIATKRFLGIGFHPDLDPSGSLRKTKFKLGPGEYFPAQFPKFCSQQANRECIWDRQNRTNEFSRQLGYRNAHFLNERKFLRSLLGPGHHETNEALLRKKSCNRTENVQFGKEERFKSYIKKDQPPPGSYFLHSLRKGWMPSNTSFNHTPTLEWDGFIDRFKSKEKEWNLAPNRYTIVDPQDVSRVVDKVVSLKGPYNLFTGERDYASIKNHFAPPKRCTPDKYYTWLNSLDYLLHDPIKSRCGQFLKAPRFTKKPTLRAMLNDLSLCYKDPKDPGPATYYVNTMGIRKLPEGKYAFNNSELEVRSSTKWDNFPGSGRYNMPDCKCDYVRKSKLSWVFKSKTKREVF